MRIKYEIGGFLNRTVAPQEILDGVVVLFDKLTSIGKLNTGEFYIDCDQESASINYYVKHESRFTNPLEFYVSNYKAKVWIRSGGHELLIMDESDMFLSKWRKKMNEIRKTNLQRSREADVSTGLPVIAEFIKSMTDYLESDEFKQKYG